MLNGLIPQLQPGYLGGHIKVNGIDLETVDIVDVGRMSATVFQNPRTQFFSSHVVSEIAYAGENYQVPPDELWERITRAAHDTRVSHLLNRSLHTLSGGQLQSVAEASALAAHVPVLLFDEPTANLSPEAITNFARLLAEQKSAGKTIVIAEHRLYFLRDLVDQVVYFHPGERPEIIDGKSSFASQNRSVALAASARFTALIAGAFHQYFSTRKRRMSECRANRATSNHHFLLEFRYETCDFRTKKTSF